MIKVVHLGEEPDIGIGMKYTSLCIGLIWSQTDIFYRFDMNPNRYIGIVIIMERHIGMGIGMIISIEPRVLKE